MAERIVDDPELPPPGRRNGAGSASILPYLLQSLAARPSLPATAPAPSGAPAGGAPRTGRGRRSSLS